jgi:hypothetical protein
MTARSVFAALAVTSLFVLPTLASGAIVEKWHTVSGVNYHVFSRYGPLNDEGNYHLVTGETSGSNERIGIRSASTGALLAQTALAYYVNAMWARDLEADGDIELIVWDGNTGKVNCLDYTTGSSTLAVRWSYLPFPAGEAFDMQFVDFDGHGELYLVFRSDANYSYAVYDRNGAQVSTFVLTGTPPDPSLWTISLEAADYDTDDREELLIRYHARPGPPPNDDPLYTTDVLYMYESTQSVGVEPGTRVSRSVELGASYPNPTWSLSRIEYSLPTSGPATLRLFDVTGREVRTLVNGKVEAGRHDAIWDGRDGQGDRVPAGVYFYELNAGGQRASRRVVRLP